MLSSLHLSSNVWSKKRVWKRQVRWCQGFGPPVPFLNCGERIRILINGIRRARSFCCVGDIHPSRMCAILITACVILALTDGCTRSVTETAQYTSEGKPLVSGDPVRDRSALRQSEGQLDGVRWQVIEGKGPKTAAEQFTLEKKSSTDNAAAATRPTITPASSEAAKIERYVSIQVGGSATTQPVTAPATRPITQPAEFAKIPILSEQGLPVEVVPLMDGRVRLIWTLRNYGGTNVTSTRDPVTARRSLTVAAPDLAPLTAVLQQQLGAAGTVTPLPKENTIIVTCERSAKSAMLDMLSRLDISQKQVEIAVRIFEVSSDFDFQQGARALAKHAGKDNSETGLSLFDSDAVQKAASLAGPQVGSVVSLMKVFQGMGISLDASFQILSDEGLVRMVSSPRMTVAAGQTGYMLAGQELPIQTANFINNVLQASTTYKPVGVQLYITPEVVGPGRVKLHTISIVSSVSGFTPIPTLSGQNPSQFMMNPVIDSREAETVVTVENASTLVISGLRMKRTTTREEKVPGLGDLPLLGWMFKDHRSQQQLTDLYFFVTPTLVSSVPVGRAE